MAAICFESGDLETFSNDQGQHTLTSVSSCTLTGAVASSLQKFGHDVYQQLQNQQKKGLESTTNIEHVVNFNLDRSTKLKPFSKSSHMVNVLTQDSRASYDSSPCSEIENPTLAETMLPWKRAEDVQVCSVGLHRSQTMPNMMSVLKSPSGCNGVVSSSEEKGKVFNQLPAITEVLKNKACGGLKKPLLWFRKQFHSRSTDNVIINKKAKGTLSGDLCQKCSTTVQKKEIKFEPAPNDDNDVTSNELMSESECLSASHIPPPWSVENNDTTTAGGEQCSTDPEPAQPSLMVFSHMSLTSNAAISWHRSDWQHRCAVACSGHNENSQHAFCDLRSERTESIRRRRCLNKAYELARQRYLGSEEEQTDQPYNVASDCRVSDWLCHQPFLDNDSKIEYDLSVMFTDELIAIGYLTPSSSSDSDCEESEFSVL